MLSKLDLKNIRYEIKNNIEYCVYDNFVQRIKNNIYFNVPSFIWENIWDNIYILVRFNIRKYRINITVNIYDYIEGIFIDNIEGTIDDE